MMRRYLVDLTTSRHYIGRNAVGIVRTEREIAKDFFLHEPAAEFFYYDNKQAELWIINNDEVKRILFFGEETVEVDKFVSRTKHPKSGARLAFRDGDVVVSAGLLWDFDYMNVVYTAKKVRKIFVAQVIYDIIPILMPEYCVPGMDKKFPKFILDTAWTADVIFSISNSTHNDLVNYINALDLSLPQMKQLSLGSDMRIAAHDWPAPVAGLTAGQYVLYVSTLEPRKNHRMLFNIWRELYDRYREYIIPLVFVGGEGWNVADMLREIRGCNRLFPEYIKHLHDIGDDELTWLYRNARFTLYPSLYEGWGLPIAESLAAHTPCIASDTSSMPEVGQGLVELVGPNDYEQWKSAIVTYIKNNDLVQSKKSHISAEYKVRSWRIAVSDFREQLDQAVNSK